MVYIIIIVFIIMLPIALLIDENKEDSMKNKARKFLEQLDKNRDKIQKGE